MVYPLTPEVEAHVEALERELQTAACRADAVRLRELLAADFVEVGASGRRYDLASVLALLDEESKEPDESGAAVIEVLDLTVRGLSPDVVQVFWDSERDGRRARRTSLWCRRDVGHHEGWQQTYHQGTPLD